MRKKPSLFARLTGSISPDNYDDLFESENEQAKNESSAHASAVVLDEIKNSQQQESSIIHKNEQAPLNEDVEELAQEGELAVDIYQTTDAIVVKALIAGVNPSSVDISITRDMITIRGHREEHTEATEENYFYKELYWGAFARTILLPEEVDVDMAEATTNHGILVIRLPKINKERKMKLKVKSGSLN